MNHAEHGACERCGKPLERGWFPRNLYCPACDGMGRRFRGSAVGFGGLLLLGFTSFYLRNPEEFLEFIVKEWWMPLGIWASLVLMFTIGGSEGGG